VLLFLRDQAGQQTRYAKMAPAGARRLPTAGIDLVANFALPILIAKNTPTPGPPFLLFPRLTILGKRPGRKPPAGGILSPSHPRVFLVGTRRPVQPAGIWTPNAINCRPPSPAPTVPYPGPQFGDACLSTTADKRLSRTQSPSNPAVHAIAFDLKIP